MHQHITKEKRIVIGVLLRTNASLREIARLLEVNPSTIS